MYIGFKEPRFLSTPEGSMHPNRVPLKVTKRGTSKGSLKGSLRVFEGPCVHLDKYLGRKLPK